MRPADTNRQPHPFLSMVGHIGLEGPSVTLVGRLRQGADALAINDIEKLQSHAGWLFEALLPCGDGGLADVEVGSKDTLARPVCLPDPLDVGRAIVRNLRQARADYITWNDLTKRPEARSLRFSDVVAGVMRRTIRATALDGENLASLRFNLNDALALRQSDLPDSPVAAIGEIALPLRKIKERFHIEHPFVIRAIELGLLPAAERCHGNARFWVKPTDMEVFLARFTTIGLLARALPPTALR